MGIKGPVLIGSILFTLSVLGVIVPVLKPDFILDDVSYVGVTYLEILLIFISGVVGGYGIGYASRSGSTFAYENNQAPVIVGGLGIAGIIVFAAWFMINGVVPDMIITVGVFSGILSFIGTFLMTIASGGDGY